MPPHNLVLEWYTRVVVGRVRQEGGQLRASGTISLKLYEIMSSCRCIRFDQLTCAAVCKIESNPKAAAPFKNMPSINA